MSHRSTPSTRTYYQIIVIGADIHEHALYSRKGDAALAAARIVRTAPAGAIVSVRQVSARA
jgi:hypothetical protein